MKRLWLILLLLLAAGTAEAQTQAFWTDRAVGIFPGQNTELLVPLPYAPVRVCTANATGSPCTPLATTITDAFTGQLLTVSGGNFGQLTTDVAGRFTFGCSPGSYLVQVAASGSNTPQLSYKITCSFPSGTPPLDVTLGNIIATSLTAPTITGTNINGTIINGTSVVGQSIGSVLYADQFSGADWCAKVLSADSQLGGLSGTIVVPSSLANGAACAAALTGMSPNRLIVFQPGVWTLPHLTVLNKGQVRFVGAGSSLTKLIITDNGGGACSAGTNGGVQFLDTSGGSTTVHGGMTGFTFQAATVSGTLDCLLNTGATTSMGDNYFSDIILETSGISPASTNPIAWFHSNTYSTIYNIEIGTGNFRQNWRSTGFFNGNHVVRLGLQPNSNNLAGAVTNDKTPQANIDQCQGSIIDNIIDEVGPNGIFLNSASGTNACEFSLWNGDGSVPGPWLPSNVYSLGTYVFPTTNTTGSITTGTNALTVASSTGMFVGHTIYIKGAGAAGGLYTGIIQTVSGVNITVAPNAGTTVVGVYTAVVNYKAHIYRVTTAGTSAAAQPAFPTGGGATVADNTVTWTEYGNGAAFTNQGVNAGVRSAFCGSGMVCALSQFSGGNGAPMTFENINANGTYIGVACFGCRNTVLQNIVGVNPIAVQISQDPVSAADALECMLNSVVNTPGNITILATDATSHCFTNANFAKIVGPGAPNFAVVTDNGPWQMPTFIRGTENASCAAASGFDLFCPNSTAHRWQMSNNNGAAVNVLGQGDVGAIIQLQCSGTATASQTLFMSAGAGTTTCTDTAGAQISRIMITSPGTIRNLVCAAGTAGTAAGSGVVTVRKSGSDQALTCTFGTATSCNDQNQAHNFSVLATDNISIKFTTQAAETLANITCAVEKF